MISLKYFVSNSERQGTCYHEFYKGKWDGTTFWKENSIFLHDDTLLACNGFTEAIAAVIQSYTPLDVTEVSSDQWMEIGKIIEEKDQNTKALYQEAAKWTDITFESYDRFTILGI